MSHEDKQSDPAVTHCPRYGCWCGHVEEPRTACKHRSGDCPACGTSNLRDVKHTTHGGVGAVGALRRRQKGPR